MNEVGSREDEVGDQSGGIRQKVELGKIRKKKGTGELGD